MPSDPQPEEAASKAPAAAASAAGSLAQTSIYGRGAQLRAHAAAERQSDRQKPTEQDRSQTDPGAPEPGTAPEQAPGQHTPAANAGTEVTERAVGRLDRSLDDPAVSAELVTGGRTGGGRMPADAAEPGGGAAVHETEPEVSSEVLQACTEHDAAAAQARLVRGQLDPPVPGPSVPAPGPGMVPGL